MSRRDGVVSRWWDLAVLGTCAVAATIVLVSGPGHWRSWAAVAALASAALVYVALGRRALALADG